MLIRFERRLVHAYETVLYAMLFAKPLTGLLLLGADDEDVRIFGLVHLPSLFPESDPFEDLFEAVTYGQASCCRSPRRLTLAISCCSQGRRDEVD